jgi:hypothetical protein
MAFSFQYWMVYLPEFSRESFLLFVHNSAEQSKLRDYSSGEETVLGQPSRQRVFGATVIGRTRFEVAQHDVTDDYYWLRETESYNSRYLASARSVLASVVADRVQAGGEPVRNVTCGRARRGSQRQLQDYVNEHEAVLTRAVMKELPPRLQELNAHIRWVSPLAQDNYTEYRDADFVRAVGLGAFVSELATFWPSGGPSWDALAVISDSEGKLRPGVILVEAKSHIPEIYGSGCQASASSRARIETALAEAKLWYGARIEADWTGPLFQSANRLAHLYFIRERLRCPAWLVNIYFINDEIGPADLDAWKAELQKVKASLGLSSSVPFAIDLFPSALPPGEDGQLPVPRDDSPVLDSGSKVPEDCIEELNAPAFFSQAQQVSVPAEGNTFAEWANRWMVLARYEGSVVPDVSNRIGELVRLWREEIPGLWQRGVDPQLLEGRYRRGDLDAPHPGEHTIEHEILYQYFDRVSCYGNKLLDGVSAFPLVRDAGGGRRANVEADMYLLTEHEGAHRLFLCEVKANGDNPWFAAVENLRQLKLLMSSPESLRLCASRQPAWCLPLDIPVTALVLALPSFYSSPGKKANAVGPALKLHARFTAENGVNVRLAVWNSRLFEIKDWLTTGM